ncbi:MAG: FtsK/SpoIIIE domain-containing protein [Candidatus Promineifilaceae bacterium]|nr:FtsK/SpoIIIE domain-containing protein [Candidatus Promineifilaceae bacterium]
MHQQERSQTTSYAAAPAAPVNLLDLLSVLPAIPACTVTLGVADGAQPLLLDLQDMDTAHLLLVSASHSERRALLRALAVSLAMTNRQADVQLAVIDPEFPGRAVADGLLHGLHYLPHAVSGVVTQVEDVQELFSFLEREIAYRTEAGVSRPRIVVLADRLGLLVEEGEPALQSSLRALMAEGAATGIHLILSVGVARLARIERLVAAGRPVRVVGRVLERAAAAAATGLEGTGAEHLSGDGDFLAVVGETLARFQAAFVNDEDLEWCLDHFYRRRAPTLLARPAPAPPQPGEELLPG